MAFISSLRLAPLTPGLLQSIIHQAPDPLPLPKFRERWGCDKEQHRGTARSVPSEPTWCHNGWKVLGSIKADTLEAL